MKHETSNRGSETWHRVPSSQFRVRGFPWPSIHDWAGIALIVILLVHLLLHWRWVLNVTKPVLAGRPGEG